MARKFDEIKVDGGKRVREVTVKIEHPSGRFEADMDGLTHYANSLNELTAMLRIAAAKVDELTYTAYYRVSLKRSFSVTAIAVSDQEVVVDAKKSRWDTTEAKPSRRSFKLDMDDKLNVPEAVNTGQVVSDFRKPHRPDDETLIEVTDEVRTGLGCVIVRLRSLDDEERSVRERRGATIAAAQEACKDPDTMCAEVLEALGEQSR